MLLELAIADAYGAGFEYADEMIVNNDLSRYVEHLRFRLNPGKLYRRYNICLSIYTLAVVFCLRFKFP